MGRLLRKYHVAELHHITMRGNGHMDLFLDSQDYSIFLKKAKQYRQETGISIHCYCLMPNHIHFLVKGEIAKVSAYLQKLEISYVRYYNRKYEHVGHLFQDRYCCKEIFNNTYYLTVIRYILHNPENAGICAWKNYVYSSAGVFTSRSDDGLTDLEDALETAGKPDLQFLLEEDAVDDLELYEKPSYGRTDYEASQIINAAADLKSPLEIQKLSKKERDEMLVKIKETGLSIRQIERVTGINRNIIQRAK